MKQYDKFEICRTVQKKGNIQMIQLVPSDRWYFTIWLYTYYHFYDYPDQLTEAMERSFLIANPFAHRLSLAAIKLDTFKEVRKRFDPDGWAWIKTSVENQDLASFLVYNPRGLSPIKRIIPNWAVNIIHLRPSQISRIQKEYPTVTLAAMLSIPSEFVFGIQIPKVQGPPSRELQEQVSSLARDTFRKINAHYGFINYSERHTAADGAGTNYERKRNLTLTDIERDLRQIVRGAFWENYLTVEHVKKLGDISSIKANAPCAQVEEIIPNASVALRLTDDVSILTNDKVSALEEYFRPLEPKLQNLNPD